MPTPYQPFPLTHWSLVHRAAAPNAQHDALTTLLTRYQPALRSYLRHVRRLPTADADDLLQSFITDKLLERQLLQHADEKRGRFRTFLLASLNNFAISRHRAAPHTTAAFDSPSDIADSDAPSPDLKVEAEWARTLIHNVLAAMHEECRRTDRMDVWTVFQERILAGIFTGREPIPYETLAQNLHLKSPTQAANLLTTAKRTYARLLRAAIAEYELGAGGDDAIDAEIADLRNILSCSINTDP
jgi:DNA-directed RNA polymerase specialized sigma24 family protein